MGKVDFDTLVNAKVVDWFKEDTDPEFLPTRSQPGAPAFQAPGIFDEAHELILEEVKGSEIDQPGHSTTAPVLQVRDADFEIIPVIGDRVTISGQRYVIYDRQPDGGGMTDLILRKVSA